MKLKQKTRGMAKHLTRLRPDEEFWLEQPAKKHVEALRNLGFSIPFEVGERLLPPANSGPACQRNANGDVIVHRDQPMETAYRLAKRHWKESHGRYGSEDHSQIVDVPFKRFPRTEVPPYLVELSMLQGDDGVMHVVAGPFAFNKADDERATNTANVFIELFGECSEL